MARYSTVLSALLVAAIAAAGGWLPQWILPVLTVALGNGLAVLGMVVLWRSGPGLVRAGSVLSRPAPMPSRSPRAISACATHSSCC